MNGNLLIKKTDSQSLDMFVATLPDVIGCQKWEERHSSNYVEERYFRCFVLGLEITVAIADDAEFKNYDFWLCLLPEPGCGHHTNLMDGIADCVARKLAQHGHEVVRSYDIGRSGSGGMVYRLNPAEGAKPRERVVIEEF